MQKITYLAPSSIEKAIDQLKTYQGRIMPYAGGTDIMVHLRENSRKTEDVSFLMDLGKLQELKGIREEEEKIIIGAMETHRNISKSPVILREFPMLAAACSQVGSPQIRNLGTIGGNVCNASPAADSVSSLAAMDAMAVVMGPEGTRKVRFTDLYTEKGGLALSKEEIMISLEVMKLKGYSQAFTKLGRRKALAISRLNVAAALQVENGEITDARIAPGCVFRVPGRVPSAERILMGQKMPVVISLREEAPEILHNAAVEVAEEMNRRTGIRWSTEYKQPALIAVVEETLMKAVIESGRSFNENRPR